MKRRRWDIFIALLMLAAVVSLAHTALTGGDFMSDTTYNTAGRIWCGALAVLFFGYGIHVLRRFRDINRKLDDLEDQS